ncbi:MAG: hypothetical protein DI617_09045 [Streptococcus pyogenes]|nr:MAG: hypothetical protein DI617_09045 [Streptococcus pyogenes]
MFIHKKKIFLKLQFFVIKKSLGCSIEVSATVYMYIYLIYKKKLKFPKKTSLATLFLIRKKTTLLSFGHLGIIFSSNNLKFPKKIGLATRGKTSFVYSYGKATPSACLAAIQSGRAKKMSLATRFHSRKKTSLFTLPLLKLSITNS